MNKILDSRAARRRPLRSPGLFRERLIDRVREVNAMTEKEVMGAAEEVNAIFGAASEQIARLRELLSGPTGRTGSPTS